MLLDLDSTQQLYSASILAGGHVETGKFEHYDNIGWISENPMVPMDSVTSVLAMPEKVLQVTVYLVTPTSIQVVENYINHLAIKD